MIGADGPSTGTAPSTRYDPPDRARPSRRGNPPRHHLEDNVCWLGGSSPAPALSKLRYVTRSRFPEPRRNPARVIKALTCRRHRSRVGVISRGETGSGRACIGRAEPTVAIPSNPSTSSARPGGRRDSDDARSPPASDSCPAGGRRLSQLSSGSYRGGGAFDRRQRVIRLSTTQPAATTPLISGVVVNPTSPGMIHVGAIQHAARHDE